jgi:hypothetical protein
MVAGLFGLGGALVGAAVSTGAVIWQQRKTAHEAERTHLLGLSEAAANEVIRLSYELQDHFPKVVDDPFNSEHWGWASRLEELNRSLEQQALRFADPKVRYLMAWIHAEILRDPIRLARDELEGYPSAPYLTMCADLRTVMGTVLRRQPFPEDIWQNYEDATPPS